MCSKRKTGDGSDDDDDDDDETDEDYSSLDDESDMETDQQPSVQRPAKQETTDDGGIAMETGALGEEAVNKPGTGSSKVANSYDRLTKSGFSWMQVVQT